MSAKVSVLTPTITGREWFLKRCIRSVKAQTHDRHEHIIVNGDGLTPNEAFARCLEQADGDYITPVSDDDWIAPHALEALAWLLDDGADFAFGQTVIVNPEGARITGLGGATMWRKSLTDRIGGFDTRWKYAGDTDLYGRIFLSDARISVIQEPLYFQTEHAEHSGYVNRDALAIELAQLQLLQPGALNRLEEIYGVAK